MREERESYRKEREKERKYGVFRKELGFKRRGVLGVNIGR